MRQDVPNRFYSMGFEEGKKQGALDKLKEIIKYLEEEHDSEEKQRLMSIENKDKLNSHMHRGTRIELYFIIKKLEKELENWG